MEGHIERERNFMIDVIGCTLAEERGLWREELAKLEARIEALESKQRGIDNGEIVSLPSPHGASRR
jgi:hypothetical protein